MPRPPGRLVSSSLSESEKLSRCSERAALVYVLTLPQHDGEGRLQVDDVSMLDMLGRFAIIHEWHVRDMGALRDEIGQSGLWRLYQTKSGKLCAEVTDWQKHQRIDKIRRGSILADEIGGDMRGGYDGGICGVDTRGIQSPREGKGREEKLREEKRESTRARISEEDAKIPEEPVSNCSLQDESMIRDQVRDEIRAVIGSPDWKPSGVDRSSLRNNAGFLSNLSNRAELFAAAHREIVSDGKLHPHVLADITQALLVGLPKNGKENGQTYAERRQAEEAKEREAWIAEARARGWS